MAWVHGLGGLTWHGGGPTQQVGLQDATGLGDHPRTVPAWRGWPRGEGQVGSSRKKGGQFQKET
jgi:hypothetical protein